MNNLLLALALIGAQDMSESQLVTEVSGKEVFPPAFRGYWSKNAETCKDKYSFETFHVGENRLDGYEWSAVLLKSTPVIYHGSAASNEEAKTVVVLTADRGETDVDIGKRRISMMSRKLYMSNASVVSEDDHLTTDFANVRCTTKR